MARRRYGPQSLLTIKQVAKLLNVSDRTVRRLVAEGKLSQPRKLTRGKGSAVRWFYQDVKVYRYRLFRGDFIDPPSAATK